MPRPANQVGAEWRPISCVHTASTQHAQASLARCAPHSAPYHDVRVLGAAPCGWAGAIAQLEGPILLGSDKEVPRQQTANAQAEEDDVSAIEAVLGPLQARARAVQAGQRLWVSSERAGHRSIGGVGALTHGVL